MRKVNSDTATHVLADACRVLASVGAGERSLDDALDSALDYPELRRTTGSLLFFYFRRKRFVDKWIDTLACRPPRPRLRRLLAAVLTQIRFQSGIVPESAANVAVELAKSAGNANEAKFVNAVLRRAVRELPPVDDVLPPAVLKRWRGRYSPEELAAMCRAFLSPAPFTFRAERGFEPPPEWEGTAVPCRGPFRFFESPKPGLVLDSEAMREGRIYIQDPATTLAASLPGMEPVRRILDVCAAPGGKSLLLSERMKAGTSLVAADRSARRNCGRSRFCSIRFSMPRRRGSHRAGNWSTAPAASSRRRMSSRRNVFWRSIRILPGWRRNNCCRPSKATALMRACCGGARRACPHSRA